MRGGLEKRMPTPTSDDDQGRKARTTFPRSRSSPSFTAGPQRAQPSLPLTACSSLSRQLSPRDGDKEDPFSLTGFFPSSIALGGTEEAWQEWGWLRAEEGHQRKGLEVGAGSDVLADAVEPLDAYDPGLGEAGVEELMRKAIREEDKLGVLSWGATRKQFVGNYEKEHHDDRLFSPYMNDEPEDHEALYLALRSRRRRATAQGMESNHEEGSIFSLT